MIQEGNGHQTHNLTVKLDPTNQNITVEFNPQEFRSWDFVVGILEAAKVKAQFTANMLRGQAMQRAAEEQARAEAIRSKLKL